ncbi:MAG TPA: fused MFS/spermidine synthase [Methylomirabilota bacterium]|nr:fused MFS/spermidine synthase [Methylomirabilota bacterium]
MRETQSVSLLLGLFLLSGVSGLVYQVVWARQLTLIFGATSPAITTVLTAFMLGLALGSFAAGRWAGRWGHPLRAYALIELGIGIYAVVFPLLLSALQVIHIPLFRVLVDAPLTLIAVRVALAAGLLLPPTTLMGASLPVLARVVIRDPAGTGRGAGALYGLNALGAAAGVYVVTFFLIPTVGLIKGSLIAASLNFAVAAAAWAWARDRPAEAMPAGTAVARAGDVWVLLAYGCSGFAALGYEVVWTRLLVLVFGSSVYAFAVMLASFLLGLGLGALLGGWVAERVGNRFLVGAWLQVIICLGVLAGVPWFDRLPQLFLEAFRVTAGEWGPLTTLEFAMASGVMILPTTAMGATFPLVSHLLGTRGGPEHVVASAYTVNTCGAILGAAVTGFALVPWLGFRGSLLALTGLSAVAACLFLVPSRRGWRRWAVPAPAIVVLAAVVALPGWNASALSSGVYLYADQYSGGQFERLVDEKQLLFYREGTTATVAVMAGRYRFLRINGKTDAGDSPDNLTERLLAHVPLLLHDDPHSVLVVGLGTGITLGTALLYPIDQVDVMEVSPEVVEASSFFAEANGRALQDLRARLRILDARTWLAATTTRYDVIISEPSNPWQTGNASLFTADHYRLTRSRLNRNGVFCQWLPFYRMDEADFKTAIRTFQSVFPNTTVWLSGGDVLLIGGPDQLIVDPARFMVRVSAEAVAHSLRGIGITDGPTLWGLFLLDPQRAREYTGDGPLHTDDYPVLEFSAPKTLYRESAPQILGRLKLLAAESALPLRSGGPELAALFEGVAQLRLRMGMPLAALSALDSAGRGAGSPNLRQLKGLAWNEVGVMRLRERDRDGALEAFRQALTFTPDMAEAHLNLAGLALDGFGDSARAEAEAREALRLRPGLRGGLVMLAEIFERRAEWSGAEAAWRQVLMADPDNVEARQGLARAQARRP